MIWDAVNASDVKVNYLYKNIRSGLDSTTYSVQRLCPGSIWYLPTACSPIENSLSGTELQGVGKIPINSI